MVTEIYREHLYDLDCWPTFTQTRSPISQQFQALKFINSTLISSIVLLDITPKFNLYLELIFVNEAFLDRNIYVGELILFACFVIYTRLSFCVVKYGERANILYNSNVLFQACTAGTV